MKDDNKKRPRTAPTAGGRTQEVSTPMPRQKLAQARKRAGLSQAVLAEKVGAHRVDITRIEGGQRAPSVTLALKIARALDGTVEALFGGDS